MNVIRTFVLFALDGNNLLFKSFYSQKFLKQIMKF